VARRTAVLAVTLPLVLATGAGSWSAAGATTVPSAHVSVLAAFGGPVHGVILDDPDSSDDGHPLAAAPYLATLVRDGVNTVSIYAGVTAGSAYSSTVNRSALDASDNELVQATKLAQRFGLHVVWTPVVHLTSGGGWRGTLHPTNLGQFFASYDGVVTHLAALAQANGVSMFYVGSELYAIANQASYWRHTVALVREVFHGPLSYMGTNGEELRVNWWSAVDAVGISPYLTVSYEKTPSYSVMYSTWTRYDLPFIHRIAARWRLPVVFGEIGFRSSDYAGVTPYTQVSQKVNETGQANAYAVLLDVTNRSQSWLYGTTLFRIGTATPPGPGNTSYSFIGKPAECVVATRWGGQSGVISGLTPGLQNVAAPACPVSG
jgi:hypothetical protein